MPQREGGNRPHFALVRPTKWPNRADEWTWEYLALRDKNPHFSSSPFPRKPMKKTLISALAIAFLSISCGTDDDGTGPSEDLSAPSNISLTRVGRTAVQVAWADNSETEDSFWIERKVNNGQFLVRLATTRNVTSAVDSVGLFVDSVYSYRVRAVLVNNSSDYSDTATVVFTLPYPSIQ